MICPLSVVYLFVGVTHVLWLNGRPRSCGSAMVPLDTVMATTYRLSKVTIWLYLQQFGRNFECNVAACNRRPRAPNFRIVS